MEKVLLLAQEESLQARDRGTTKCIPLVNTHNGHTTFIPERANRHRHFLQSKERLARIFREPLLIAHRRPKSLRDTLVGAKMTRKIPEECTMAGGCGPFNQPKCSWSRCINITSTFIAPRKNFSNIPCSDLPINLGDLHYRM